ncbi:MAG TPA: hypothetical protein VNZ49_09535, partial [Bacteroidia bacterium]|nr:hypothetical protein [Bacteroidia bacterium]
MKKKYLPATKFFNVIILLLSINAISQTDPRSSFNDNSNPFANRENMGTLAAPVNNSCASATTLGSVSTTTTTTGTLVNATADKASTCHSPTHNVWYTFVVPAGGGSYSVSMTAITMTYPTVTVYSGTCASLTQLACSFGSSTLSTVSVPCLSAGTYYINCDEDFGTTGTFSITVTQTSAGAGGPTNNACASSVNLGTVSTTTTTTGDNTCATADQ